MPFEPIDKVGIETGKAPLFDEQIKSNLFLDQGMQAPHAVFHIEGEKILHP